MRFVRILTVLLTLLMLGGVVPAQTGSSAKKSAKTAEKAPAAAQVDINHATTAELKTLNGIGEAYSLAIIKNRPYKNKTQLRSKGVIPAATYDKIKDQIVAKQ